MKKILLVAIPIMLCSLKSSNYHIEDSCEIFGIIYFEKNKYNADAIVYEEEDETQAQLLVFKEENRLFADKEGVWYITDNPAIAHHKLFLTKDIRNADFTFYYIEDLTFAGCQ